MSNVNEWKNFKISRSLRNLSNIEDNLKDLETLKDDEKYKDDNDLIDYLSSSMDEICKLAVVRCTGHIETVLKEMILKFLKDANTHNHITQKIKKTEFKGANPNNERINEVLIFIFGKDSEPHLEFKNYMKNNEINGVGYTDTLKTMVIDRNSISHGDNVSIQIESVENYITLTKNISERLISIQSNNQLI